MPQNEELGDFEEDRALLQKDAHTRRRHLSWFNKCREDFESDRAYDDYLEKVEDIVYNMVHGIDLEGTRAFVAKYRRENADSIAANSAKRAEESRNMLDEINDEKRLRLRRLSEIRKEEEERKRDLVRKRKLIEAEELVRVSQGEEAYKKLVKKRQRREKKENKKREEAAHLASGGALKGTQQMHFRLDLAVHGYPMPKPNSDIPEDDNRIPDDESDVARAGGFRIEPVRQRALLEFEQCMAQSCARFVGIM